MSGELEAAGALATAGAAGAALEGREGGQQGEGACPNCNTPVTGRFCSNCGQHTRPIRKLTHVLSEFLHNLWHLDTKSWRTMPMVVFRPGTLTRNYVYGKRARYLSPLTMFLFSIFLMFFAFSTIEAPNNIVQTRSEATAEDLAEAREELAQARAELEAARTNPSPDGPAGLEAELAQNALNLAQAQVDRLERQLAEQQAAEAASGTEASADGVAAPGPAQDAAPPDQPQTETWQDEIRAAARSDDFVVVDGDDDLNERIRRKFENPDLALYQIQDAASKFSFLLAPMSLPFIALLFLWKRGVTLYDHMAYALYALSFAAILFSAVVLLGKVPWIGWAASWLLLALPVHMYFHLGGAYALGWWSALWRTFFMLNFAFIVALAFTILVIVLGLAG
jgi:hypothetical protein